MGLNDASPKGSIGSSILPPEFDYEFYVSIHKDLSMLTREAAESHFRHYGEKEGRPGSPLSLRENFIRQIDKDRKTLEIGPFCLPMIQGPNVSYFDVLDRAALIERAKLHNYPYTDAPEIDYVSPTGDLSVVDCRFEQIVSSHCIEHQPDLVRHFQNIERLLLPGGRYYLVIPDKRYCFDHFIHESTIVDVLGAFLEERKLHSVENIIEHQSMITHNTPALHWAGEHGTPHWLTAAGAEGMKNAIRDLSRSRNAYIDVHAWQFSPNSFRSIMNYLKRLDLVGFQSSRIYNTVRNSLEFYAVFEKA